MWFQMNEWIFHNRPEDSDIKAIKLTLDKLTNPERTSKREEITDAIIADESSRLVILSGPGTGKTHLFLNRIKQLLNRDSNTKVLVTTFVKKLAKDLQSRINQESTIKGKAESQTFFCF
jgi:superfamily I DNA and RNA helicase